MVSFLIIILDKLQEMSRRYGQKQRSSKDDHRQNKDKDRDRKRKRSRDESSKRDKRQGKNKEDRNQRNDRVQRNQKRKRYDDDDDRNIKRKHRSRTPESREKQNKKSRERSFRGERKQHRKQKRREKRKYRFDSPPRSDDSNVEENPQEMNKLNRMKAQQQLVSTKADRKLYLGNLPPNITTNQLLQLLNSALKKMNINTDVEGDSIVSAWISPDGVGHYAFIQFRTKQEASRGMDLNNASLFGYQLKLGRPKQYLQYNKQLMNDNGADGDLDGILKQVAAMGPEEELKITEKIIYPPSKVLILKHIVALQELGIDEQYDQIMEDVKDMASRFGAVRSITIPRPINIQSNDIELAPRVKGLGYVFIQYQNAEIAKNARRQFLTKMFSERSVACGYFDEKQYAEKELDIMDKVIITF